MFRLFALSTDKKATEEWLENVSPGKLYEELERKALAVGEFGALYGS
jgi:hypothetical protein